tara:strand:- start:15118 stop:16188 length:1071 start_codon:yes stop_codon:yes gene_type:complete
MIKSLIRSLKLSWQRSNEPDGISFLRQLGEMSALVFCSRLGPGNYHKYRLWQKEIPWSEKRGYWHDQKYYEFLNRVNPYSYRIMARNKVLAKALLHFYSIPDADYVAYLSSHGGVAGDGRDIARLGGLEALLMEKTDLTRLCFKPVEGSGGDGFCAAEIRRENGLQLSNLTDDECFSVAGYVEKFLNGCATSDYIVEAYLDQHPALAIFNPSSLNTLRVWVGRSLSGRVEIVGMYLRVGKAGSLVDNLFAGGFGLKVDFATFKTQWALPYDSGGQPFQAHPDSGVDMSDCQLPFRQEVIDLSKRVLEILPSTQFVGLDIAFTPDRPVIIEFNLAPMASGARVLGRSHAALLGWIET